MAKAVNHKCNYKHCKNPEEIIPAGEGIIINHRYYHPKCAEDVEYIKKSRELYVSRISNTVVMSYLNKVLNTIVHNKGVDSKFLYFSIKYATEHNRKINDPAGLYYLVDNSTIKKAYISELKSRIVTDKPKCNVVDDDFVFTTPTVTRASKPKGFADILKDSDNIE